MTEDVTTDDSTDQQTAETSDDQQPSDVSIDDDSSTTAAAEETVVREKTVIKNESRSTVEYLELAALAGLISLAAVAGFGFYSSASHAISQLISPSYEPLFQAAFNLVLLLAAFAGLSVLARRRYDLA